MSIVRRVPPRALPVLASDYRRAYGPDASPPPSQAPEGKLNFGDIWLALREGKWVILLTALLVAGAVAAYTFTVRPQYEASTLVRIGQPLTAPQPGQAIPQVPLTQEIGILTSSLDLAQSVLASLRTAAQRSGRPELFPFLEEHGQQPPRVQASELVDQMAFTPSQQQSTIYITATSSVPQEAATIASAYAAAYQSFSRDLRRRQTVAQRQYLEQQVTRRRAELDSLGGVLVGAQTGGAAVAGGTAGAVEGLLSQSLALGNDAYAAELQLRQLQAELAATRTGVAPRLGAGQEASALQAQLGTVEGQILPLRSFIEPYYANNPELRTATTLPQGYERLAQARETLARLEAQRDDLRQRLAATQQQAGTGGTTDIARIEDLRRQIATQTVALTAARARKGTIDGQLARTRGQMMAAPQAGLQVGQAENEYGLVQTALNGAYQGLIQARLAEESEIGYVTVLREAFEPTAPVSPNVPQNLTLGLLLGIALGVGLAFVRHTANHNLRRPEDLKGHGYQLIGVIPPMNSVIKSSFQGKDTVEIEGRERSTRLLPLLDPWSPISENYRFVRTNLRHLRGGADTQVLLVTSPSMSDGKTTTCVNLAVTSAQGGLRTLLIEADLRRPGASKLLGFDRRDGLAEVLEGERWPGSASAEQQAQNFYRYATDIENLWFIPAGKPTVPPAELLGSPTMEALIAAARLVFDVILIDSPPVLAVTDPVILAPLVDSVALVISNDRTDLRALDVTRTTLEAVGARIAGVIVNRFTDGRGSTGPYTYGYYSTTYGPESDAPAA